MPSSNVRTVYVGMPGPPGSGVTAGELAALMPKAGGTFTGGVLIQKTSASALKVAKDDATALFYADSNSGIVWVANGYNLSGYSDDGTTETFSIDAATGAAQFDSTVSATRHIGESLWLTMPGIEGGGSAIGSGIKYDFVVPYNLTVTEWMLLADQTGSISIEIWLDTYANFPPTVADLVTGTTGSNNPRISSATKGNSSTLTNWTTDWTGGTPGRVNVNGAATSITRCAIALKVTKT